MWLNLRRDVAVMFSELAVWEAPERAAQVGGAGRGRTPRPSLARFIEGYRLLRPSTLDELRAVDTVERMRVRSRAWKERNRERVAAYSRARYATRKAAGR